MSDIELVIKIDEEEYKARQNWVTNPKRMVCKVDIAIANGIPLPKGHGRIGDLDVLQDEVYSWGMNDHDRYDFIDVINEADAIIEADDEYLTGNNSEENNNTGNWCNTCEYKYLESECHGCAEYDEHDNLIGLRHYKREGEVENEEDTNCI